jgi:putative transposase
LSPIMNQPVSYKRHRYPPQIIAHAVWLYFRFPLSRRLAEELLLERGIVVSYETIRCWARKFGPEYARRLKRKLPSRTDMWHLDEVVISIAGKKHWLWRAVDQDGYVLDEIVQSRRNTKAAKRLLTRLLQKQGMPPKRYYNRQAAILRRGQAPGHAARRASLAQRPQQSGGEFTCSVAKTGADDAAVSITGWLAAFRHNLLRHQKSLRPVPITSLRTSNPHAPPASNGRMEGRHHEGMILSELTLDADTQQLT